MKWMTSIATGILLAAGLAGCGSDRREVAAAGETVHGVKLAPAQEKNVRDIFEATGTVQAAQTVPMAAEMTGYVQAVNVREGDRVKRGQVLVRIDDAQARAGLEQAQAALSMAVHESAAADSQAALAESTLKRYQELFDKKSVSPLEFDEVKARSQEAAARREMARSGRARAEAALQQAKTVAGHAQVRAPFDGIVTARRAEPGTLAVPGMPLVTVESGGRFRLEATVNESDLKYARRGEAVPVVIESLGERALEGKVIEILPAADPSSRSFTVKIELPVNAALRSGLFGRALFSRGTRPSLIIPQSAVLTRGQLRSVYVVGQDKAATLRYVTLGRAMKGEGEGEVEVLSGVSAGELLVAAPGDRDLAGKRIEVR